MTRLARGTMLYSMGGRYLDDMLAVYRAQDRSVWAQELALTPEQERALQAFVWNNARPENADYIYDYYTDNCSTRARDALDAALGGQLRQAFGEVPSGTTWRWHTRRLLRPVPWAEAGIQLVLGNPGDAAITQWEEMFLPMLLRSHLADATVVVDGETVPLVVREVQLLQARGRALPPEAPANRMGWALLAGLLLAGGFAGLGGWAARTRREGGTAPTRVLGLAVLGWSLLLGGLGWILLVAWAFTDHDFWGWNENLFLASPFLLAGVWLAIPLLRGRAPGPRLRALLVLVAGVAVAGVALKLLPGVDQGNWEVVAALLPAHLVLAREARRAP